MLSCTVRASYCSLAECESSLDVAEEPAEDDDDGEEDGEGSGDSEDGFLEDQHDERVLPCVLKGVKNEHLTAKKMRRREKRAAKGDKPLASVRRVL